MIEVKELRKSFGPITAVDGVSFSVGKGDVLGFLGPNGAGKSTTMKMIACFLAPDSGTAAVCGCDICSDPVGARKALGYLPENAPLYEEMTVRGFLSFVCDARGISGAARRAAIDSAIERCTLGRVAYQTCGTLSKGFRRRVGLAQALIHNPPVLILDEPTDGLDPNQKYEVRSLIQKMSHDTCILVSTHILEEVDAVCNRMIIIAQGRILSDSTPAALRSEHGGTLDEIFRKITVRGTAMAAGGVA